MAQVIIELVAKLLSRWLHQLLGLALLLHVILLEPWFDLLPLLMVRLAVGAVDSNHLLTLG